jgi:UDP-N-acetylglucosamine--dolichyl-phosphate N-acetylglucosaminephosphotransferase
MLEEVITLALTGSIAFAVTLFLVPKWMSRAKAVRLVGRDMNKRTRHEVPESGGIIVMFGFLAAMLFYVFLNTFFFSESPNLVFLFAALLTVTLAAVLGFMDDVLGWKKGIRRWQKPLLTLPIGIPLMVVNAGQSQMVLPFLGITDLGLLYPLLVIPLGVVGAANGFNMLAGYNGLEAGMGAIILASLGSVGLFVNSDLWIATIAFSGVFALMAFLVFNWNPAKIFPGDSLTYGIGALIATVAILGNMEKIAIVLFVPFFLDALLSLWPEFRGLPKVEAFGKVNEDNSLEMPYKGIRSFEHFAIYAIKKVKRKCFESDVTLFFYALELALVAFVILFEV